jgi:hypothetical protein
MSPGLGGGETGWRLLLVWSAVLACSWPDNALGLIIPLSGGTEKIWICPSSVAYFHPTYLLVLYFFLEYVLFYDNRIL